MRFLLPLLGLCSLLAACGDKPATATGPSTAAPQVRDGSLMEPGRPQLAALPASTAPGVQPITWNMWWGENGRHWALYVDGKEVRSGTLTAATPAAQQATVELPMETPGRYEIKVALCNDHGCSESEPVTLQVTL